LLWKWHDYFVTVFISGIDEYLWIFACVAPNNVRYKNIPPIETAHTECLALGSGSKLELNQNQSTKPDFWMNKYHLSHLFALKSFIIYRKNETRSVSSSLSQIFANPPTSTVPFIATIAIDTIITTACKASVHKTALKPPWHVLS